MKRLIYFVKYTKLVYLMYYYIGSFILNFLRLFIATDDNLILFLSFGGRKFDDSPKSLYDELIKDCRFDGFKLVWAFNNPECFEIPRGEKIKTDTWKYYVTALKARVWITNSSIERGLTFKGNKCFYINTWHGSAIKRMGSDIKNARFLGKGTPHYDVFSAQGQFDIDVFSKAFNLRRSCIHLTGLPRNDVFSSYSKNEVNKLRDKLNIPLGKKVILYAPTFREYESDAQKQRVMSIPIDLSKWHTELSDKYVLLFRAHYEVVNSLKIDDENFIRDVSKYKSLEDLMMVSDILISDYSSIVFDYSIMHKPILCFVYDYERYTHERGLYIDVRNYFLNACDEDGLIKLIKNVKTDIEDEKSIRFQKEYVTHYGNASHIILEMIAKELIDIR